MKFIDKLTNWYFSRRALPYWSVLLIDCLCVLVAGVLSFALNHGGRATLDVFWTLFLVICGVTVFFMIGFRMFHTYHGGIRYLLFTDLIRVSLAVIVGLALIALVEAITGVGNHLVGIGVSDIVLSSLFLIAFMWIIRVWVKTLYEGTLRKGCTIPVFIFRRMISVL